MPSFESPLGNKKFGTTSPLRELDIPDETEFNQDNIVNPIMRRKAAMPILDDQAMQNFQNRLQEKDPAEIEREFREARRVKVSGKERLNEGAKRRLEMLLNMTRTTHEVNIGENIFVLQTIPSKSMREAIMVASEYDGTVQAPFEARRQFLARSIVQIAGVEFGQFVGSDSLQSKLSFIDELDEPLLNTLYGEYLKMSEIAKNKYSVKNNIEAKEIVEDLKK